MDTTTDRDRQVRATHRAGDFVCLAAALVALAAIVGGVVVWLQGSIPGGLAVASSGLLWALLMYLFGTWAMAWAEVHQR